MDNKKGKTPKHLWKKGQSGNPNGRPKKPALSLGEKEDLRDLALSYALDPTHEKHHEYLMKMIDKVFPSLRATEMKLEGEVAMPVVNIKLKD